MDSGSTIAPDFTLHGLPVESGEFADGQERSEVRPFDPSADEELVAILEATARYRVLRCVPPLATASTDWVCDPVEAVALDIETTGLDSASDEPIELAMVRFRYDRVDGCFLGVVDTFSSLNEPSIPIPSVVTRLTGISDADVAGHAIDPVAVAAFVDGVKIVVAHNAAFDRAFAEASWPVFKAMPWACSCTGIQALLKRSTSAPKLERSILIYAMREIECSRRVERLISHVLDGSFRT